MDSGPKELIMLYSIDYICLFMFVLCRTLSQMVRLKSDRISTKFTRKWLRHLETSKINDLNSRHPPEYSCFHGNWTLRHVMSLSSICPTFFRGRGSIHTFIFILSAKKKNVFELANWSCVKSILCKL